MKLVKRKSGSDTALYIVKYLRKNGKPACEVRMKCGLLSKLKDEYEDPIKHFENVALEMTSKEKREEKILVSNTKVTEKVDYDNEILLDGGYLFLRKIYRALSLDKITKDIQERFKFKYDLDDILEKLVFSRLLKPASKLMTYEDSLSFIEKPNFELHDIYRALNVLNEYCDYIQEKVYQTSSKIIKRNTKILYFDCTNYFFEIEQEDEMRRYGVSKEHRPNPIVQMGLFMDGNGIPLAFDLNPGNTNEQVTLRPFEEKIIKQFKLSKFIVCTDAGLGSYNNKCFNDMQGRGFIVTQSLKKLAPHLKSWALSKSNFIKLSDSKTFKNGQESDENDVYYKSRYIKEDITINTAVGKIKTTKEWRLLVTYSKSYALYQKRIRNEQIKRAKELIEHPERFNKVSSTDCKRFVSNISFTNEGEIANKKKLSFDNEKVMNESVYDGYYAIMSNLEGDEKELISLSHKRWKIEESFRIMKTNLKARPVYVSLKEHITAHFLTCFLALLIERILEAKLDYKYTTLEIITALQKLRYTYTGSGYLASFKRNLVIDELERIFNMDVQYKGFTISGMRNLINISKR